MLSVPHILVTQMIVAHVNVRVTLKPYVHIITSHLQKHFIALAGIPALWIEYHQGTHAHFSQNLSFSVNPDFRKELLLCK